MSDHTDDMNEADKAPKRSQPHRPAGVKQPQDRKPPKKTAAQREAEGVDTVPVEWEGLTFYVPSDPDEWDFWTVTEPLSANNIPQGLMGLLGPKQALELRKAKPKLSNTEARALFDAIGEAVGTGSAGN